MFDKQRIDHISFQDDLPEKMTKEMYIRIFKKIWATIRHDLWKELEAFKKTNRVTTVKSEDFDREYERVIANFETVRADVYELMMDCELERKEVSKEIMQKAYITFSTVTHLNQAGDSSETVRSRWADQVTAIARQHGKYIGQMISGNFYPNIEKDPRLSKEGDEKVDLSSLPGYTGMSTQKTFLDGSKKNVQPVNKSVDKYIEKMREIAKKKVEKRMQETAKEEQTGATVEEVKKDEIEEKNTTEQEPETEKKEEVE